jgi:peptidoglycan hydrolase-like protein with peptidoglycan-binding domain
LSDPLEKEKTVFLRRLLTAAAVVTVASATALGAAEAHSATASPMSSSMSSPTSHVSRSATDSDNLLEPGDKGRAVRVLQARLKQIGWFNAAVTGTYGDITREAVRGFQAKRGFPVTGSVDRRTMKKLRSMTRTPTTAELHNRSNTAGPLDRRCTTGRVLCIDKRSRTLRWVVDGRVRQTLDARFGAASTPTREGVFEVYLKSRDHVSRLYGSAMPFAMFFSGGQAVHYSSDFASVGYAGASHGCVNIRDYAGISRLFDRVRVGDKVVVYWS